MKVVLVLLTLTLAGCACVDGGVPEQDIRMRLAPVSEERSVFVLGGETPRKLHSTGGIYAFKTPSLRWGGNNYYLFTDYQIHGEDQNILLISDEHGKQQYITIKQVWELPKDEEGVLLLNLKAQRTHNH